MVNPARALSRQFLGRAPLTLLVVGIVLALADFGLLYRAAVKDGVLYIEGGVGLLQNYGLLATVLGNSVYFYLARKYYDAAYSIKKSKALINAEPVENPLSLLTSIIKLEKPAFRILLYVLILVGALYWTGNVRTHVFGDPKLRWGDKMFFDTLNHRSSFYASKFHDLYSWVIVLPFVGFVLILTSFQYRRTIRAAVRGKALHYDLLNPDRRGGFLFVEKAHLVFNLIIALIYLQVTMHIETFKVVNAGYVSSYMVLTLLLISVNRIFLGHIYSAIKELKLESLNKVKDKAYNNDKLSFEILKYCYERRIDVFAIINFVVKSGAIIFSGAVKFWPIISKALIKG